MAIKDDWTIDEKGNLRHVEGKSAVYPILELMLYLRDTWGEELINTPSYHILEMEDPLNINDESAKYLKEGTVTMSEPGSKSPHTIYSSVGN
jgi:hypothetical protein